MVTGINHITLTVSNIREAFDFYTRTLGMTPVMRSGWSAYFLAGDTWVAIVKGAPRNDERYDHIAFDVSEEDFEAACAAIKRSGSVEWKPNESEGASFYFRDPSGNKLEIHTTDLKTRIRSGKASWGEEVEWFI